MLFAHLKRQNIIAITTKMNVFLSCREQRRLLGVCSGSVLNPTARDISVI